MDARPTPPVGDHRGAGRADKGRTAAWPALDARPVPGSGDHGARGGRLGAPDEGQRASAGSVRSRPRVSGVVKVVRKVMSESTIT